MIYHLLIPTTFEDNEAVRVLEWHGAPGGGFMPGMMVVEVETHKALVEIRAEQPGILRRQCFAEGEWCPLGGVLAIFSDEPDEPLDGEGQPWPAAFRIG